MSALNDAAARACRAWLLSSGMAAQLDIVRHHESDVPIPAPGLDVLVEESEHASLEACHAAGLVARLGEELLIDHDDVDDTKARTSQAAQRVHLAVAKAERAPPGRSGSWPSGYCLLPLGRTVPTGWTGRAWPSSILPAVSLRRWAYSMTALRSGPDTPRSSR
jgi:hypothetical protein